MGTQRLADKFAAQSDLDDKAAAKAKAREREYFKSWKIRFLKMSNVFIKKLSRMPKKPWQQDEGIVMCT